LNELRGLSLLFGTVWGGVVLFRRTPEMPNFTELCVKSINN